MTEVTTPRQGAVAGRPAHVRLQEHRAGCRRAGRAPNVSAARARRARSRAQLARRRCRTVGAGGRTRAGLAGGPARVDRPGGRAPRHRQGGDPGRDPRASRARSTKRNGSSYGATQRSASASSRLHPRSPSSRSSSATATSAGTARGYPDGLAGEAIPLGSRIVVRLRRLRRDGRANALIASRATSTPRSRSSSSAPARSSIRTWWRPSSEWSADLFAPADAHGRVGSRGVRSDPA